MPSLHYDTTSTVTLSTKNHNIKSPRRVIRVTINDRQFQIPWSSQRADQRTSRQEFFRPLNLQMNTSFFILLFLNYFSHVVLIIFPNTRRPWTIFFVRLAAVDNVFVQYFQIIYIFLFNNLKKKERGGITLSLYSV